MTLALIAAMAGTAHAGTAQIGHGDRNGIFPILADNNDSNDNSAFVEVLLPNELVALPPGSVIDGLDLDKLNDATTGPGTGSFQIYLANTSATSVDTTMTVGAHKAGATLVYSSTSQHVPPTIGWVSLGAFNGTPFTYTGGGLKVIMLWSGDTLPAATRSYNRSYLSFAAGPQGITTGGTRGGGPINDSSILDEGPSKPNLRLHYTPPATPWLVLFSGFDPLVNGASYSNQYAFAAGTATDMSFTLLNAGGGTADLSGGVVYTNQVNTTNATPVAPPTSLAGGASAPVTIEHTPIASAVTSYTTTMGTFSFSQQGPATSTPRANHMLLGFLQDGRTAGLNFGPAAHDQIIGANEDFDVVVFNAGTAPFDVTGFTFTTDPGIAITSDLTTAVTVNPQTEVHVRCHVTVSAAGTQSATINVNASTTSGYIQLQRTGVTATSAPPAGAPHLDVAYGVNGDTPAHIDDADTRHPGLTDEIHLILQNTGDADLTISDIVFECDACSPDYVPDSPTPPLTIPQSGSEELAFQVNFDPGTTTIAHLHILSNDSATPYDITLSYASTSPPAIVVDDVWHGVVPQTTSTLHFPVHNGGGQDLTISAATISAVSGGTVTVTRFPASIAPGADDNVDLAVTPADGATEMSFTLTIKSNDPIHPTVTILFSPAVTTTDEPHQGGCAAGGGAGGTALLVLVSLALVRRRR